MARRTKILATVGPSSDDPRVLAEMIEAGVDVFRIGLAHGSLSDAVQRYRMIREVAKASGKSIGILADLPGPKVRIGQLPDGGVSLQVGATIELVPGKETSTATSLGVDYLDLLRDVQPGDSVALGDGTVRLTICSVDAESAKAEVASGGAIQGRPGLHIPSDRLGLTTPTAEDLYKLDAFVEEGVDMIALSFVRSAHDVRRVGTEPYPRGPLVIAKIETRSAVDNLEGIIGAAGAVMVARGDLGIEMGIEELPHLQKRIIRECIAQGKPVITATQMLESMITNSTPTRAEVSDVANAVFDGSSVVMLSAETAIGLDPVNVVATMSRICGHADDEFDYNGWATRLREIRLASIGDDDMHLTDAMTGAAWRAATEMGASAIIAVSESGFTVRSIARFRPSMPILGFSTNARTRHQLTLSWGTTPLPASRATYSRDMMNSLVLTPRELGHIKSGDTVAVLAGGGGGSRAKTTDLLRLVRVP